MSAKSRFTAKGQGDGVRRDGKLSASATGGPLKSTFMCGRFKDSKNYDRRGTDDHDGASRQGLRALAGLCEPKRSAYSRVNSAPKNRICAE